MKKILFGMLLTAVVCGCEMDLSRSDTMSSEDLRNDPSAAVYTTDGIYSIFKDVLMYSGQENTNNTYTRHWFQMAEFRGDNVCLSNPTTDVLTTAIMYTDVPSSSNLGYFWFTSYKAIFGANSNIEAIPEGASNYSDHLLGENYFLRAVCHLNLLQLFAKPYSRGADNPGVVLRTSTTDMSETKRATVGEVYEQIVKDLKKAAELMVSGGRVGKDAASYKAYANHEAALGMLTRAYLHMGEYDECIKVCNELLGGDASAWLDTDLDNYFVNAKSSKETLWCIAKAVTDHQYYEMGQIGSMYYSPNGQGGIGWAQMYWSDPLIELFNRFPDDKRFAAYFELFDAANDGRKMVHWPAVDGSSSRANIVLIGDAVKDNGDGSYSFTYEGKSYTTKSREVNGATLYYIEGYATDAQDNDDFEGGTQVFVRPNIASTIKGTFHTYPLYMMKKFTGMPATPLLTDPVMIRYGEVLLNRAEAYAHKGDATNALADVNVIRKRAGLDGDALMTEANMGSRGYSDVLDVVLDERRLELCFEGFRPYDLYRNNRPINRKFAGVQIWETLTPDVLDEKFPYCIPSDEVLVSHIQQNR